MLTNENVSKSPKINKKWGSNSSLVFGNPANLTGMDRLFRNSKSSLKLGAIVFLVVSLLNFFFDFSLSYVFSALGSLAYMGFSLIISRRNFFIIRALMLTIGVLVICATSYLEGIRVGNYLFLFDLLCFCIFIHSYTEKLFLFLSFGLIALAFVFVIFVAPQEGAVYKMTEDGIKGNFILNLVISLTILMLLSYNALRVEYEQSESLIIEQAYLNTVYNTSLDAIFIVNTKDFKIVDCNAHSIKLFGASEKDELIKRDINSIFQSKDFVKQQKNSDWQGEANCEKIDGAFFSGYVSIVSITHGGEEYLKINVLDISKIKGFERELILAKEKAELGAQAKSTFLSNMSHELRTPLNGIIGTISLMAQEAKLPHQIEYLEQLTFSSEHMLRLINDVLDFSKIEASRLELEATVFNPYKTIKSIKGLFASQFAAKKLAFHTNLDEALNRLYFGDVTKLNQVLVNLVSNALKFTEEGFVIIEANLVSSENKKGIVYFSVKDTGIGIAEGKKDAIFQSFSQGDTSTTRKYGGTGLGLSISKEIIQLFGSEIKLESQVGVGSHFFFTVILDEADNIAPISEPSSNGHYKHNLEDVSVLLVEDNPLNMLIAQKFLENWKAKVITAKNGVEALSILQSNRSFDVLLLDLEMPELDGYGTIKSLQQLNIAIPAIAFTAAIYENIKQDLLSKGFVDYLQKPFKPIDLLNKINAAKLQKVL